jgi:hypothetical protein
MKLTAAREDFLAPLQSVPAVFVGSSAYAWRRGMNPAARPSAAYRGRNLRRGAGRRSASGARTMTFFARSFNAAVASASATAVGDEKNGSGLRAP